MAGTILDKFGVRGVFECCKGKGKEGRNPSCLLVVSKSSLLAVQQDKLVNASREQKGTTRMAN